MPLNDQEFNEYRTLKSQKALSFEQMNRLKILRSMSNATAPVQQETPISPTLGQRFASGFAERNIPQPKGFELGDVAEFVGGSALPTAGGILGAVGGPWGAAAGAAAGKSAQKAITQGIGAFVPGFAPEQSAGRVVGDVALTGALQKVGDVAAPYISKGAGVVASKVGDIVGEATKRLVSATSGVSTKAIDAAITKGDKILKYVGLTADDLAEKGIDIQNAIKASKTKLDEGARYLLGKRYTALKDAEEVVAQHLTGMRDKMVTLGQDLQEVIPTIKEKAGAEYKDIITRTMSKFKNKKIDIHGGTTNAIKSIRDEFGYGVPSRNPDPVGQQVFTEFQNRIIGMGMDKRVPGGKIVGGMSSIEDAFYLQKDLGNAIFRYRGTEPAAALGKLREAVFDTLDTIPGFKAANSAYRNGIKLLESLDGMTSADDLSKTVINAFKTGANKRDALLRFAGADPKANKILKDLITTSDDYVAIEGRNKAVSKMAQGIEKIKDTYSLGDVQNTMVNLAKKDPVIKKMLADTKDPTELYNRVSGLMNGDKAYKQIVDVMSKGGNQKKALAELNKTIPGLQNKINTLQDAVMGQEFTAWLRNLPQTGMGFGVLSTFVSPKTLIASPLFSPRIVGMGAKKAGEISRAVGGMQSPASKYVTPPTSAIAYELMRDREQK